MAAQKSSSSFPPAMAQRACPGKPLVPLAGTPMIQRVYERAKLSKLATRVVVATDDERIIKAVDGFGGEARMTRPDHRTGTERVAEVAAHMDGQVFVNVQGDEPLLNPEVVDAAIAALLEEPPASISTVATPIKLPADIMDPNMVKPCWILRTTPCISPARPYPGCATPPEKLRSSTSSIWDSTFFNATLYSSIQPSRQAHSKKSSSSSNSAGSKMAGKSAWRKSNTTPSAWTSPKM